MQTVIKKEIVIDNSHSLFLADVPFDAGEKVLIFMTTEHALQKRLAEWKKLFKETQALPDLQSITEADIEAEIKAYRAGL
jgi:hypothetical protein